MKIIKILFVTLALSSLSSCVILTVGQYEEQKKLQALKDEKGEVHNLLLNQDIKHDTCNLGSLLKLISNNLESITNAQLDEFRINMIKNDLVNYYKVYKSDKPFVISENELQSRLSCYLDYILNPKYEYVPFWEFWKDSYYLKFPCKH